MSNIYTTKDIEALKKNQFQNNFIKEHKDVFFSVCNKILDFLYTEEEIDPKRDNPLYSDLSVIKNTASDFEMTRKKIHESAPLSEAEIVHLTLASQYACADMKRLSEDFLKASQELDEYIKTLTFQDK